MPGELQQPQCMPSREENVQKAQKADKNAGEFIIELDFKCANRIKFDAELKNSHKKIRQGGRVNGIRLPLPTIILSAFH